MLAGLAVDGYGRSQPTQVHVHLLKERYGHDGYRHGSMLPEEHDEIAQNFLPRIHIVIVVN